MMAIFGLLALIAAALWTAYEIGYSRAVHELGSRVDRLERALRSRPNIV